MSIRQFLVDSMADVALDDALKAERIAKLEDALTTANLRQAELEAENARLRTTGAVWADEATPFTGEQVKALLAENARLRTELQTLSAGLEWAEEIVAGGVQIMTPTQLGQWEGVRAWQEFHDDPAMNVRLPAEVSDVVKAAIAWGATMTDLYRKVNNNEHLLEEEWRLDECVRTLLASPFGAEYRVSERDGEDG